MGGNSGSRRWGNVSFVLDNSYVATFFFACVDCWGWIKASLWIKAGFFISLQSSLGMVPALFKKRQKTSSPKKLECVGDSTSNTISDENRAKAYWYSHFRMWSAGTV
ncbi:hypothetical protein BJV82DRAFT_612422 [Fennellomyces sp. T-0311]|nr:hypothetical protein BJV82DRAFT_612422 [Fennellomyces sp. T-0311]